MAGELVMRSAGEPSSPAVLQLQGMANGVYVVVARVAGKKEPSFTKFALAR
jgi:hypothetical protein